MHNIKLGVVSIVLLAGLTACNNNNGGGETPAASGDSDAATKSESQGGGVTFVTTQDGSPRGFAAWFKTNLPN